MLLVSLTNVGLFWLLTGPNPLRMDSEAACVFCVLFLGGAVMLLVDFYALNWIGMWMAMRTKRHHRAVLATLARAMLVSWLAILFFMLIASAGGSGRKSAEAIVLTVLWCSLGAVVDFMFATRAKVKLLLALRETSPQAQGTSPDLEFSESLSTPKGASL